MQVKKIFWMHAFICIDSSFHTHKIILIFFSLSRLVQDESKMEKGFLYNPSMPRMRAQIKQNKYSTFLHVYFGFYLNEWEHLLVNSHTHFTLVKCLCLILWLCAGVEFYFIFYLHEYVHQVKWVLIS